MSKPIGGNAASWPTQSRFRLQTIPRCDFYFGNVCAIITHLSVAFRPDPVAIIVTEPLTTNEQWTNFAPGELKVFVDGEPLLPGW